ncbi:hypothetical protein GVAV_000934 [Gurleya vavrai]
MPLSDFSDNKLVGAGCHVEVDETMLNLKSKVIAEDPQQIELIYYVLLNATPTLLEYTQELLRTNQLQQ